MNNAATNENSGRKQIVGSDYSADIEWHKEGHPVIYCVGRGKSTSAREALSVIATVVEMINAGPFEHVCSVYNMLEITHMPMLARFVRAGNFPTSSKTAHIIIGTQSQSLQLVTSVVAVLGNKRLRTMEACKTQEEIEQAVKRWLLLPDRTRAYTINDI
jgi:hypothetical protein